MPKKNQFHGLDLADNRLMQYVVRIAVVFIVGALGIFLYRNMHVKQETDTQRGLARIQEMEAIDVAETEKTIRGLRGQTTSDEMSTNEELTTTLKGEYLDASLLIVGDSAAQMLLDYDILDDSCVIATIGSGAATGSGDLNTAIALAPQNLVLDYGLDDLVYYSGNVEEFIADYETLIRSAQEGLPRARIYVCEITPVASDALESQPEYGSVEAFNERLRKLCRTLNVTYLETARMVDEYATDGVHPAYSYYVSFAKYVLEQAAPSQAGVVSGAEGADSTGAGSADREEGSGDENE